MLPARACTFRIAILCANNFGSNISSLFSWIHLPVTEFIEEVDDLNDNCVDDVLYGSILDTSSIFGAVVGGSAVYLFLRL